MDCSVSSKSAVSHILVVDDVADNSFLLQSFLELEGYQVEVAEDGYSAIAKTESAPPALILLDVMMPGINGFEVAQHIRQNHQLPFIPILLVTGHDAGSLPQAEEVVVDGLIHKPIAFDELLKRVQAILHPDLN